MHKIKHCLNVSKNIKKNNMETKRDIKKVSLKYGTREKIANLLNVNRTTVTFAVTGRTNSKLSKKIRKVAVEMGGDPIY